MSYPQATSTSPDTDLFNDLDRPMHYASFWQRFAAAFLDGILVQVVNGIIVAIMGYPFFDPEGEVFDTPTLISLAVSWLYFALQESGPAQATLGKRAMGIKVCDLNGARISFGQATGRHFGKIVSTFILLIGYLMMLWDSKKQTLHDKMANTLVVENRA